MSTKIYYAGQDITTGTPGLTLPVPFVGRSDTIVRYGEKWGNLTEINLRGQLTGCSFSTVIASQSGLLSIFNRDYQNLEIIENGSGIYTGKYVEIKGIDFSPSKYVGILDYSISLNCYQENLFSGTYGVLDPSNSWEYEEGKGYLSNLTHSVSARGFNTTSGPANAFQNAKNFVLARTGLSEQIYPRFISGASGNYCLKESRERINRFNATYGVTETYIRDTYFGADGLLRYSTNFDCNINDSIAKVTVQGEINGCGRYSSMSGIRTRYSSLDLFGIALDAYSGANGDTNLNPYYISSGVTEDPYNRKLNFNVTFDNTSGSSVYMDYGISIDLAENDVTTVNFNGTIRGRGDSATRWQRVQDFYANLDAFALADEAYNSFSPDSAYPLNPIAINDSVSFNQFAYEITVNKTWNNKELPPPGFKSFNYTLHFNPSLEKVISKPLANLCGVQYYVADLGFLTRPQFSVDGNGKFCPPNSSTLAVNSVRSTGNALFSTYCSSNGALLEDKTISTSETELSFRFSRSTNPVVSVTSPGSYQTINNLNLR